MNAPDASVARDGIAVIGIGCRFPGGVDGPASYWRFLREARAAIRDVPPERWDARRFYHPDPRAPGMMHVRRGGFLEGPIDLFDAEFFGVSGREAARMDPQQRLLLEVAWEAIENAALAAHGLAGSSTGVFIGGFTLDNLLHQFGTLNRDALDTYSAAGSTMTMLAARISHFFDFRGPSFALDTACSSSLVATHLACQSLLAGECTLALAGGVNLMFKPEYQVAMAKGGFLSPDGRSKAFGVGADGYGRGEGAGVVVLKKLASALADHDPVWAVIRGTAVNQDGHTPGITVPNGDSQEAVARAAYASGGVSPGRIRYVEAHGTGTSIGDATEVRSLASVLSEGRGPDGHCFLGSVKPNIGHLEAAAGVAGLIKAVLVLSHGEVPPHDPGGVENPDLGLERTCLRLPGRLEALPREAGEVFAAVNSFGYGGTNAHVVLSRAPPVARRELDDGAGERPVLLPLTARSPEALRALAGRMADFLDDSPEPLDAVAATAATGRTWHPHRLAVVAGSRADALARLRSVAEGDSAGALLGRARPYPQVVFVYTGMGPQWWAMGRQLLATDSVFRASLERCDSEFREVGGFSLLDVLSAGSEGESRIQETRNSQAGIFAIQVGLTERLEAWGIVPAAVVGHSVGEVASAWASGGLSLEDAVRVSYHRGRLQQTTAGRGRMLATGLSDTEARQLLEPYGGRVEVAAVNAPRSVTLSGAWPELQRLAGELEAREVFCRPLQVEVAFHSHQMDPLQEELLSTLSGLAPRREHTPYFSTVTGGRLDTTSLDAAYWWRNVRQPVRFADAVEAMAGEGLHLFLEVGPHPVLARSIRECMGPRDAVTVATLRRGEPEAASLLAAAGALFVQGVPLGEAVEPVRGTRLRLPAYPWQRERHWQETEIEREDRLGPRGHPLLGMRERHPLESREVVLSPGLLPYLADHRVQGAVVFPAAGYLEIGLALARQADGEGPVALETVTLHEALVVDEERPARLHVLVDADRSRYQVHGRATDDGSTFTLHASSRLSAGVEPTPAPSVDLLRARCTEEVAAASVYERLRGRGLEYGPLFQGVERVWLGEGEALTELRLPQALEQDVGDYVLHPVLLDAAFHASLLVVPEGLYLPVAVARLQVSGPAGRPHWAHASLVGEDRRSIRLDVRLLDEHGATCAEVHGLECRALGSRRPAVSADLLHRVAWTREDLQSPPAEQVAPGRWLVLADRQGMGEQLAQLLEALGHSVTIAVRGEGLEQTRPGRRPFDPLAPDPIDALVGSEPLRGVVHLLALDASPPDELTPEALRVSRGLSCTSVLHLAQALARREWTPAPRVWLVTRGAQPVEGQDVSVAQTPLLGLVRCWANEHPEMRAGLIDLSPEATASDAFRLLAEILGGPGGGEVAYRGDVRYAPRVERLGAEALAPAPRGVRVGAERVELVPPRRAGEPVGFRIGERTPPGEAEIEIAVRALVLTADDVQPTAAGADSAAERERSDRYVAGVVTAAGAGVSFEPGEAVFARVPGPLASHAVVAAERAVPAPPEWSHEESARAGAYLAAAFGLLDVAALRPGERLYVDGGASGAGLAAAWVGRHVGARVVAAARSDGEARLLESFGVTSLPPAHADSGSAAVVAALGAPADVVAAVGGAALSEGIGNLAPFGRLVELEGQRPSAALPDLRRLPAGGRFGRVDLDALFSASPARGAELLARVFGWLQVGALPPLPLSAYPVTDLEGAVEALEGDAAAGPVVLTFSPDDEVMVPQEGGEPLFGADGTYLVTGGLGGFGLRLAEWMTEQGARHLVLAGRSGAGSEAVPVVEALRGRGATVVAAATDVSDPDAVSRLLERVRAEMPPLRGVVHGAMVLDDDFLHRLDDERLVRVLAPKAMGAWNLALETRNDDLDVFVLLSSISSLIGNPGQGSYDAANAFLDGLAHHLRARRVPALAVNLGAVAGVGAVARDSRVEAALRNVGIEPVAADEIFVALESVLRRRDAVQVGLMRVDWRRVLDAHPALGRSGRFERLADAAAHPGRGDAGVRGALLDTLEEERPGVLRTWLRERAVGIMGVTGGDFPVDRPLTELGLDSMMAGEFAAQMERELSISIPMVRLLQGPSLDQLADQLLREMAPPVTA